MTATLKPTGLPIKTSPIEGADWIASLYRTLRYTGRRIVVTDRQGKVMADTGDCYGNADAVNRLNWLLAELLPIPEAMTARFESGWVPAGPSIEDVYYRRWQN